MKQVTENYVLVIDQIYNKTLSFQCNLTISTIFQIYHGGQFYWWRKPEYPQKTKDLVKKINALLLNNLDKHEQTRYITKHYPFNAI
jgi:hypothetical protein